MAQPFDIRLDDSPPSPVVAHAGTGAVATPLVGDRTFYIETFGCQMNDHDSEKVAGVLMARGYRPVEDSNHADVVFYNTCSIRERAAQKVFSHLGAIKK